MDDNDSNDDKAEDEKAGDDETGDDETGDDEADDDPSEERLDEVGQRIDRARSTAEETVEGVEQDEERFADSGSEEAQEEDDQSAAPG